MIRLVGAGYRSLEQVSSGTELIVYETRSDASAKAPVATSPQWCGFLSGRSRSLTSRVAERRFQDVVHLIRGQVGIALQHPPVEIWTIRPMVAQAVQERAHGVVGGRGGGPPRRDRRWRWRGFGCYDGWSLRGGYCGCRRSGRRGHSRWRHRLGCRDRWYWQAFVRASVHHSERDGSDSTDSCDTSDDPGRWRRTAVNGRRLADRFPLGSQAHVAKSHGRWRGLANSLLVS
jgi:hypothetical protein